MRFLVAVSMLSVLVIGGTRHAEGGPSDPVAYWSFDGDATDSSGNGHNGVVYGATLTEDRFGVANHAFSFDGSNDYIAVAHHADLNSPDTMTIAAWFKPDSFNLGSMSWPTVLKKMNDAEVSGYSMEIGQVFEWPLHLQILCVSSQVLASLLLVACV